MTELRPCPYPIGDLLPLAPPMIVIDEITGFTDDRIQAAVTIRADAPFCRPEGMPAHVLLEYMGQTCGALGGLQCVLAGRPPRIGYLLGSRDFRAARPLIAVGTRLVVTASLEFIDCNSIMSAFDCRVDGPEGELATAQVTMHLTAESAATP